MATEERAKAGRPHAGPERRYHGPGTVDELTEQNVRTILELDETAKARRTPVDRLVDLITHYCGTMSFVWLNAAGVGLWLVFNSAGRKFFGLGGLAVFDPYPFPFLSLLVSLEAIFVATFILISQNQQRMLSERRNHLGLQINLLTEQENTKMLSILSQIAHKVGIDIRNDPDIKVLEAATRPDMLVEQIERGIEATTTSEPS